MAAAAPHCSATDVLCVVCSLCADKQDVHRSLSECFGQLTERCSVRHPVFHRHLCDRWRAHRGFEGESLKGVGLTRTLQTATQNLPAT